MKERPILFSAPMVRAILAGQKTQTRRVVKFPSIRDGFVLIDRGNGWWPYQSDDGETEICNDGCEHCYSSPYGQPSDRLWVRETWQHANSPHGPYEPGCTCFYRADYWDDPHGMDGEKSPEGKYRTWIPSIHMPRSVSRILLEVVSVRVERLHDISEADAVAEGIHQQTTTGWFSVPGINGAGTTARAAYALLWNSINGRGSWDANPWVWVVEFKQIQPAMGEG